MSGSAPAVDHPSDRERTPRSPGGPSSWRSVRPARRIATAAFAAVAIFGLGTVAVDRSLDSPPAPDPPTVDAVGGSRAPAQLTIESFRFGPSGLRVALDIPIQVTNRDQAKHTFTSGTRGSPDGHFDLRLDGGARGTTPPLPVGTYRYFCTIHPGMNGVLEVQP